jgi:hypothetical protein
MCVFVCTTRLGGIKDADNWGMGIKRQLMSPITRKIIIMQPVRVPNIRQMRIHHSRQSRATKEEKKPIYLQNYAVKRHVMSVCRATGYNERHIHETRHDASTARRQGVGVSQCLHNLAENAGKLR